MKKYFFLAAVASVMLAACNSDNDEINMADDGQLRLSTQNTLMTRGLQSDQLTQFAANEVLDIFINESGGSGTTYTQPLGFTADGSGNLTPASPVFWPESGNGVTLYGVYPSGLATTADETGISFTVNADQSTDANFRASDLMTGTPAANPVARTSAVIPLTFTHLLTKVDINLTPGAGFTAPDLAAADVFIMSTKPTTTFDVQSTTVTAASGTAAPIKAFTGTAGSAIIVPAQTLAAATPFIKVTVGGGDYVYNLASATTFAAQTVYTYNITVSKSGLTVSSAITPWTAVGPVSGTATLQ